MIEIEFQFARSSGPGGQNVNKVNSQAQLFWKIDESAALHSDVIRRLKSREANRITKDGVLRINSQRYRDQGEESERLFEPTSGNDRCGTLSHRKRERKRELRSGSRKNGCARRN